ncbi:hypothetical protein BC936DRAFT_139132 [Jimgerdemannia flammicorona]|uniref:Transcription elongation factor 1 homolog n=1 Tax=Jimgerdemannia flammicorona TaxID=994334 RepID=A0A433BAL6_9FUNG|nr:hypothetical protein BC936DRAFT_139132 [Jimgerdemannia flammicorona]
MVERRMTSAEVAAAWQKKVEKKAAGEKERCIGHSVQLLVLQPRKQDHPNKVGHLFCKVCDVSFQCPITYLSEATDVYHEWIDACDAVNKVKPSTRGGGGAGGSRQRPVDGEEEDDYEERDRGGGRRRYADGSEEEED